MILFALTKQNKIGVVQEIQTSKYASFLPLNFESFDAAKRTTAKHKTKNNTKLKMNNGCFVNCSSVSSAFK